ncbi:hypothetical protein SDC9_201751 [bioreactor metagenome]|uniref:Uncharacterized protein n=1 Tax=bioreactor metagenome TaxID=1076179 RepID=A0A645ITA3_9ZZZZ
MGPFGQRGSHRLGPQFPLVAESSADGRDDHPYLVLGQAERLGQLAPHEKRALRAGPYRQAFPVELRDRDMPFDADVLQPGSLVFAFNDIVGLGKSLFHIAVVNLGVVRDVRVLLVIHLAVAGQF